MTTKLQTAPLDPALVDRLLDLLSGDDAYRTRFQHDTRSALGEIGYCAPSPGTQMTACGAIAAALPEALIDCKVRKLASKETIAAARNEIRHMLTRGLNQNVPQLDAMLTPAKHILK